MFGVGEGLWDVDRTEEEFMRDFWNEADYMGFYVGDFCYLFFESFVGEYIKSNNSCLVINLKSSLKTPILISAALYI